MSHLFTMLDFSVADPSLPVISAADYELLVDYEPDAYEHWVLGSTSASLVGKRSGLVLAPAGSSHTFGATKVTIPSDRASELVSTLADGENRTMCGVFIIPSLADTNGVLLCGNINDATEGYGLFLQRAGTNYNIQTTLRGSTGPTILSMAGLSAGSVLFFASSVSFSGATNTVIHYAGSKGSFTANPAGEKTTGSVNLCLGNARYNNANYINNAVEASEFIIYDRALTVAELDAVYARSKIRLAGRGVTVV